MLDHSPSTLLSKNCFGLEPNLCYITLVRPYYSSFPSILPTKLTLVQPMLMLKSLQNKKGQKIWGTRQKSSPFRYKRTAFLSGTPNFFGPSCFEAALVEVTLEKVDVQYRLFETPSPST